MEVIQTRVCVFGGGIAGLWLLNELIKSGYTALLLETDALGAGQTGKSQGIIHGGTKYTLQGRLTEASESVANMPEFWRRCIREGGEVDLRQVRLLSDYQYMWALGNLGSHLSGFFASKALSSRVRPVSWQEKLSQWVSRTEGRLYQLDEPVLDIQSLINTFYAFNKKNMLKIGQNTAFNFVQADDRTWSFEVKVGDRTLKIVTNYLMFAAGSGNEVLCKACGLKKPKMQRRSLHMVFVRSPHLQPIFLHCLGIKAHPRLTITSHQTDTGDWLWYLGGELSEVGVMRSSSEQIAAAQAELRQLFPRLSQECMQWGTLRVDRAEPRQKKLLRPNKPFCHFVNNIFTLWPTKLALTPLLSEEVFSILKKLNPTILEDACAIPENLPKPDIAQPFWAGAW